MSKLILCFWHYFHWRFFCFSDFDESLMCEFILFSDKLLVLELLLLYKRLQPKLLLLPHELVVSGCLSSVGCLQVVGAQRAHLIEIHQFQATLFKLEINHHRWSRQVFITCSTVSPRWIKTGYTKWVWPLSCINESV